jgi:preprotein translocase subunit YajC
MVKIIIIMNDSGNYIYIYMLLLINIFYFVLIRKQK